MPSSRTKPAPSSPAGETASFDVARDGHIAGTRLAHAEVNALVGLSSAETYERMTIYTALEPCHLCLAAATSARIGRLRYAAVDLYGGAVGKLLPSEDMRLHPLGIDGPLSGASGLFPELLHVRHMLWRLPDSNVVALYRRLRPELIELVGELPAPPDATTLDDAFARIAK